MNREIKFRGRNDRHGWLTGHYFVNRGVHFIAEDGIANPLNTWEDYSVDPETVGQYTGLKDRNGKDIYEGDLLKSGDVIFEVWWSEDTLCYMLDMVSLSKEIAARMSDMDIASMEICGNRWDNPELLEGGK